jgi:cytosine/adenosine deaminase-related metal-dependent hydrolase
MSLILKNATFVDWQTLKFKKCDIRVQQQKAGSIEFMDNIQLRRADQSFNNSDIEVDCTGKFVTKSFGCAHHHIYSALAAGLKPLQKKPTNFLENLKYLWWKLDRALDLEIIKACALVTAVNLIKNGVTFVIDHHSSPNAVKTSLSAIAEIFDKIGISHLLCYELSDRNGKRAAKEGLEETEGHLSSGRQGLVGLHASFTVGDLLLKKAVLLAEKYSSGLHIHTAEDIIDQEHCMKKYKKRVVERLNNVGVLNFPKTILAHCLHLNKSEKEILKESKIYIAENVESNLKNRVGYFNSIGLTDKIMLGTDGMHSDMLKSMKVAFNMGKIQEDITLEQVYKRFRMIHNYINENNFYGDEPNNLIILDYDPPSEIDENNFLSHFIFGIDSRNIESVISNGKFLMRNRQLKTIDEDEVFAFAREMGKKLNNKIDKLQ